MLRKLGLFLFLFSLLLVPILASGYDYTGTIRENGDQYWDDNEITFIDFELDKGERLEIEFEANGNLELMVCDCSSYEDIEEFGEEILYDGTMPEDLYLWLDSYAYTSGDVEVSKRVDVSVAIFSVDSFNPPTMSYTLTTNLPKGDRIDDGGSGLLIFIIIVAVVIGIIVYKKRSNSSKNANNTSYANTSTYPTQQTQYNQSSQQSQSSQVGVFCPNCGSKVSTTFCTECGTKVN